MNLKTNAACPPSETLDDFVHGKLEPPILDQCESHISECPACLETLRGLGSDDTLTGHLAAAMNEPDSSPSSEQFNGLMERMLSQTPKRLLPGSLQPPATIAAELMADRAAEVLRCLEPTDDESLGAIGDYDLERLIGAGSSGVVFKAIDRTLNRPVALKVLRPSLGAMARQRFIAEAQSAASIDHPNVVTIYQVGESKRLAFMAMQWIPGQTLEQQLAAGKQFEQSEVRTVASQISAGLQAAHEQQIIHRDIKPANIWITEADQSVKILDFGLARISDDDPGLTATGMLAGTPNFMSPEQTKGLELDGRSDLFSLGCLMYRLLTGRLPFGAPTVLATLQSIQNHQPVSVQNLQPAISDELTDLTMALLEKHPANRPASANQLTELLTADRSAWPVQINRCEATSTANSQTTGMQKPATAASGGRFFRSIAAAVALGVLGWGGYMFGPQIIRIATDQGEISIETEDPDVQVEILKDGKLVRVVDTKTDQSFSIRSGNYEFRAAPASGSETGVTFDVTPKQLVMNRGQQQIVKVTKNLAGQDAQSQHAETSSAEDLDALIYDGKNFEQWMRIAKTDRSPKNLVNAIRACGALASSPDEQKMLFEIIDSAARRYGNNMARGEDEKVMEAMLAAIWQHPPELAADFVQKQLQSGNTRSQQFCTWVLIGGLNSATCPNKSDFDRAFASRANELLPIEVNKDQNLSSTLIGAYLNVSAQELKKLNPTIQATTERLYWEQAQVKDSQAIDRLGELAAHVRVEDQKIVSHLVERYRKIKWLRDPKLNPAFRALTYSALQNYNYSDVQPITDWHDEVRAKFFAEVLEQELSQAAVEHRFQPITVRPTNSKQIWGYSNNPLQLIYGSQECLNAILYKLNNEQRKSIRDRLVKIQKDLPTEIKNWSPSNVEKLGNDIEHNLKALIAKCDGGEEPVFIGIQEAKGSVAPGNNGFGGGGGGRFGGGGGGFGGGVF